MMEYVKAKKKFGQNFLKDKNILNNIASSVNVNSDDLIIEIGAGMGALTEYLVQKNCNIICYEIDERMKNYLAKYESDKVHVFYDDFMKRDILNDLESIQYKNLFVVANIPYYITSPIITKLINLETEIKEIVLLVQKEFAERICASHKSKDYNAFTLFVDATYDASLLFEVPRNSFIPVPNVDSAVIKLVRKENSLINNKEFYLKFVRDAFMNKRKTLKNNLKQYDWNKLIVILTELGYQENVRAEEISKDDFKKLVNEYERKL